MAGAEVARAVSIRGQRAAMCWRPRFTSLPGSGPGRHPRLGIATCMAGLVLQSRRARALLPDAGVVWLFTLVSLVRYYS